MQESRSFTGTVRTLYAIVLLNNLKNKILTRCDGTIVLYTSKVEQAEDLYPELKANLSNVVVTLPFINNGVLVLTKLKRYGGGLQMVSMKALSTAEDSCKMI